MLNTRMNQYPLLKFLMNLKNQMTLPTALTVFNRSMINLENEINIVNSYSLQVVSELQSNILFYTVGNIKTSQRYPNDWFEDYEITYKINNEEIVEFSKFEILFEEDKMIINEYDKSLNLIEIFEFTGTSTLVREHTLPFDLIINKITDFSQRNLVFTTIPESVKRFRSNFEAAAIGTDSDQLSLKLTHENIKIANDYLTGLMRSFDNDGIVDRQLEYKRTIEFVDKRAKILRDELDVIEKRKEEFKSQNSLSDLKSDADINIKEQFSYNNELFDVESQITLATYLKENLSNIEFDYLPINIGLKDFDINSIISNYNQLVSDRSKYLSEVGPNNYFIKSIEKQIESLRKISLSQFKLFDFFGNED